MTVPAGDIQPFYQAAKQIVPARMSLICRWASKSPFTAPIPAPKVALKSNRKQPFSRHLLDHREFSSKNECGKGNAPAKKKTLTKTYQRQLRRWFLAPKRRGKVRLCRDDEDHIAGGKGVHFAADL